MDEGTLERVEVGDRDVVDVARTIAPRLEIVVECRECDEARVDVRQLMRACSKLRNTGLTD
jgi:hypothetical protein